MAETFGDYILDRKLGAGGMAVTYLAREQLHEIGGERVVTVKQILPHYGDDPNFRTMFLDEARISTLLNHRNICRVYRAGEIEGTLFMAMEFIDGHELADLMALGRERGAAAWPPEHALFVLAELLEGLHSAHTQTSPQGVEIGLVHRDVSPQNVLISHEGEVKVIDFGVAKATTNLNKTEAGAVKGKVAYFSPEQLQAKPLDGRSDIFAAGLLLYELLTGEHPFKGPDEHAIIYNFVHKEAAPPSSLRPGLSPEIDALVMRAIAKDRDQRFPDARTMARACMALVHTLHPGYQQHHLEAWIGRLLDTSASLPRATAIRPAPAPTPPESGAPSSNRGLVALLIGVALVVVSALVAFVVLLSDDEDEPSSRLSEETTEEDSQRIAADNAEDADPLEAERSPSTGADDGAPNPVGSLGDETPDEAIVEEEPTPTEAGLRRKLTRYQTCLMRALPRAHQSHERYFKWAPRGGLPTCKERYISYGLYGIYDDASELCAGAIDTAWDEPATPELDADMRRLVEAFDALVPVVAEATTHFKLKEYEISCVNTQAIHTRLVPAFEALFEAEAAVREHLDPRWLESQQRHLEALRAEGGHELEAAAVAYALAAARFGGALPETGNAFSEPERKALLGAQLELMAATRGYLTRVEIDSDEASDANLTWLTRAVEDLHEDASAIAAALREGKTPKEKHMEGARQHLDKAASGYIKARF